MKKFIVIALLVMPFVLIYFISFSGRILSKYTHINIENIYVSDTNGNIYNNDSIIQINKGDVKSLQISILPTLASNKSIVYSNSDKSVCKIDEENNTLEGVDYGFSKVIITAQDRRYVQVVLNVQVVEFSPLDIYLPKENFEVVEGKWESINAEAIPSAVVDENKILKYESLDDSIATCENGIIFGLKKGNTKIKISTNNDIVKFVSVSVLSEYGQGIYFDYKDNTRAYIVNEKEFDLKNIILINLPDITFDDIQFSLDSISSVDDSKLKDGIVVFNKQKEVCYISITCESGGVEYSDSIAIMYLGDELWKKEI